MCIQDIVMAACSMLYYTLGGCQHVLRKSLPQLVCVSVLGRRENNKWTPIWLLKKKIVYTKINPFYKTSIKPLTGEMHRHVCAHSAYLVHATS